RVKKPTLTCGRPRPIVFGLLFTMKTATRTCEPSASGDWHRARHGARGLCNCRADRRLLSISGITIARVACPAKPGLWEVPFFVLFRPAIDGPVGRPTRRRPRGFPACTPPLTGKGAAPGCGRPPVFLLLFTGKYRAAGAAGVAFARCRCRSASLPLRGVGGARVRDLDGAVATFQKPHARGRARASRL